MYATGRKKMLNMLILNILREYSDDAHHLPQQEIVRLLKQDYEMTRDRRSVGSNIETLQEMGYEIVCDGGYFLTEREFEDAELRLLIDAVLFSHRHLQRTVRGERFRFPRQGLISSISAAWVIFQ